MMYSAYCRQPGETAQAYQDEDQDLAKRRREEESHGERGSRRIERGAGYQDYSWMASYEWDSMGGEIIPAQIWM